MIALINGVEGSTLGLFKGGDTTVRAVLLNDDGGDFNITGLTTALKIYNNIDRATLLKNIAGVLTTPLGGLTTFTVTSASMDFAGSTDGTPYYAFIEVDDVSNSLVYLSRQGSPVFIK